VAVLKPAVAEQWNQLMPHQMPMRMRPTVQTRPRLRAHLNLLFRGRENSCVPPRVEGGGREVMGDSSGWQSGWNWLPSIRG
jgi:hypothetical protein